MVIKGLLGGLVTLLVFGGSGREGLGSSPYFWGAPVSREAWTLPALLLCLSLNLVMSGPLADFTVFLGWEESCIKVLLKNICIEAGSHLGN